MQRESDEVSLLYWTLSYILIISEFLLQMQTKHARVVGDNLNCSTCEKLICMVCCEYVELKQEPACQTVTQLKNGFEKDLSHAVLNLHPR